MSTTGPLSQPGCIRTGMCCQRIPLPVSPRKMRESYENWLEWRAGETIYLKMQMSPIERNAFKSDHFHKDIELIYPMLMGRCLGKIDQIYVFHYLKPEPDPAEKTLRRKWRLDEEPEEDDGGLIIGAEARASASRHIDWMYIYGPCKFFERVQLSPDGKRMLGGCSINAIKPTMCATFPNGDNTHENEMLNLNRGTFRGCGYNHPGVGVTFTDITDNLVPLDADET
jgi:Fe-S-cluster containining protein